MPTILAIETSSELACAALLHGEHVILQESAGVQTHSQTILPMVQSLLQQAGIGLAQCDAIAFGAGPGSFTGVRTACGIAQGLAFGAGLPVVPVVTLAAMAQACREATQACNVLAILDARMGEVYWAQYRFTAGWEVVIPPTLSAPAAVHPQGPVVACGNGLSAYASCFDSQPFAKGAASAITPHAAQIAQLARQAFAAGLTLPAREAQPLYLRNKVALTTAERSLKTAKEAA
jgi:tRNA threonylcarbamoyladenosine biosynthesis protein TsaB